MSISLNLSARPSGYESRVGPTAAHYHVGHRALLVSIILFVASTVFDPADKLLGLKVPLFCACWAISGVIYMRNPKDCRIPAGLALYVFLMISIPLISIGVYFIIDGRQPFEGFGLFKAYLFVTFTLILYLNEIDFLKWFSRILTLLAAMILIVYVISLISSSAVEPLRSFGQEYGIISLDEREYSADLKVLLVFFVTSPMLVVPIAYYLNLAITCRGGSRYLYFFLAIFNTTAMFLAGTRNNFFVSALLPTAILALRSRRKIFVAPLVLGVLILGIINYRDDITIMLSADEVSNSIKLAYLSDYARIFSNPAKLLFGEGLGAYHYWSAKGYSYYITELTYLEVIRNFGLIFGGVMLSLMFYPIVYAIRHPAFPQKSLIVAYGFYLLASASNPLFFSSEGMAILCVVLANIFLFDKKLLPVA